MTTVCCERPAIKAALASLTVMHDVVVRNCLNRRASFARSSGRMQNFEWRTLEWWSSLEAWRGTLTARKPRKSSPQTLNIFSKSSDNNRNHFSLIILTVYGTRTSEWTVFWALKALLGCRADDQQNCKVFRSLALQLAHSANVDDYLLFLLLRLLLHHWFVCI